MENRFNLLRNLVLVLLMVKLSLILNAQAGSYSITFDHVALSVSDVDSSAAFYSQVLNLEEITPEDIDSEAPLFGDDGLGLDSIDALEIILILERNYGIKIENPAKGKEIFYSVRTLADYITAHQK